MKNLLKWTLLSPLLVVALGIGIVGLIARGIMYSFFIGYDAPMKVGEMMAREKIKNDWRTQQDARQQGYQPNL